MPFEPQEGTKVPVEGKITAQIGEDGDAMVELTQEANIIAAFIKLEASDTTPPSNPSADDILTQVTAGDEDARNEINQGASDLLVAKYQEGRDKILGGVAKILGTLAVVGGALLFAAATVATAGAAAAFLEPDTKSNLKFLDSFTNWHVGTQQIRPQIKNLPTGTLIIIKIEGE